MQMPFDLKVRHVLGVLLVYHCLVSFYYSYTGELMDSWGYYKEMMVGQKPFYSLSPFYFNGMRFFTDLCSLGGLLPYWSTNLIFGLFSFVGIYLSIISFKDVNEKIDVRFSWSFLLLFLPSWHYWTARIGKEAILLLSLGFIFYGLFKAGTPTKIRGLMVTLGVLFAFSFRAHFLIMLFVGVMIAYLIYSSYSMGTKLFILIIGVLSFYGLAELIMTYILRRPEFSIKEVVNLINERANTIGSYDHNYSNLEYNKYSFKGKLFTFLYRPFFEERYNHLILISLENLIFLVATASLLRIQFLKWLKEANPMFLTIILYICGTTILMSQLSSNMGYANRQKSSILFCFIILFIGFYTRQKESQQTNPSLITNKNN